MTRATEPSAEAAAAPRFVRVERDGHVTIVVMQRSEKRNAISAAMRAQLHQAFDEFEADDDMRCAILIGEGRAFSAGADMSEMAQMKLAAVPRSWDHVLGSGGSLSKPVIAAVNGYALAGGFYIAQCCDLCIAAESAQFGITEARRGRGAPWAVPLIHMVPRRIMMELLVTGAPISARRAVDVGLVNAVVPDEELLDAALTMAKTIASNAPLSVQAGKRLVQLAADVGPGLARDAADWLFYRAYTSEDGQEGPRAFIEKREPKWQGR